MASNYDDVYHAHKGDDDKVERGAGDGSDHGVSADDEDEGDDVDLGTTIVEPTLAGSRSSSPQYYDEDDDSRPEPFKDSSLRLEDIPLPTTSVPLSSPGNIGPNGTPRSGGNKLEFFKNWTISTYKCSRQTIFEKLGKTSRTVDTELETQIEELRDTQRKYSNILKLARALTSHFYHVVHTQSALGEAFGDLSNRSPELQEEFLYNADTQRNLVKNGEQLIGALNFFVSSVNTLCNKTMEDTIATVKQYEASRVEYDAYRSDLDFYAAAPKTEVNQQKQRDTQDRFSKQKSDFEKLRSDVQIKLKFLDENRVKVMHKQLLLFHNAISAYFSGNAKALEATMAQFSIQVKSPNSAQPSWVEQ